MKHAVYTGTRNIYGSMETAAKSLIANSDVGKVHFLIEDAEFPRELPEIIECRDVSRQDIFESDGPNMKSGYTYMALLRAALWKIFPDLSEILSLDCDTIAVRDCSGAWDVDVSGCYFAATQEKWPRRRRGLQYTNVGVSLHNLDMQRDGKGAEVVALLNSREYAWPEQDALNYLCQGRIADMPASYNSCPWTASITERERIIHFAAEKSWPAIELAEKKKFEAGFRNMPWDKVMDRHYVAIERSLHGQGDFHF